MFQELKRVWATLWNGLPLIPAWWRLERNPSLTKQLELVMRARVSRVHTSTQRRRIDAGVYASFRYTGVYESVGSSFGVDVRLRLFDVGALMYSTAVAVNSPVVIYLDRRSTVSTPEDTA